VQEREIVGGVEGTLLIGAVDLDTVGAGLTVEIGAGLTVVIGAGLTVETDMMSMTRSVEIGRTVEALKDEGHHVEEVMVLDTGVVGVRVTTFLTHGLVVAHLTDDRTMNKSLARDLKGTSLTPVTDQSANA